MNNITNTNNGVEQAAEVTEGKYTYRQMLSILEAFSDDELSVFGQCTLNDMLAFLNNPNGVKNMVENCRANINAAFVEIALLRKLEKAMSENLKPAESEDPEEPEEKKKESNRSVSWYYPSYEHNYGRRNNPYGCTSALSWL